MIKPTPGKVLAYLDYEQEEFLIAAVLSGDKAMQAAYESGDCYLFFAKLAGAVPPDATKKSHGAVRDLFKTCILGLQYGMESRALAGRIERPEPYAKELINYHKRFFAQYWKWQRNILIQTRFSNQIHTCYGWKFHTVISNARDERTVKNFLIQATGAEILRVACCLLVDAGIKVCAPIHDAVLIECDEDTADATINKAQEIMQPASRYVLGKPIRTEAMVVRYPDCYVDPHAGDIGDKIMQILKEIERNGKEFL